MWMYVVAAVALYFLVKYLLRLPTVGKYGERHVFITGCDTGFGNLLAKKLDSLGFHVYAGCFTEKGEDELRKSCSANLKTLLVDVTKVSNIENARATVEKYLPSGKGLWAIVNNAGVVGPLGMAEWLSREDFEKCLAVNLYGVIDVTRVFLPLVRKGKGRVVNISSIAGRIAIVAAPYCVSKYGVEAFTDCLRREVLKQGITVHLLEPGYFETEILNRTNIRKSMIDNFKQTSPEMQKYYGPDYATKTMDITEEFLAKTASPHVYQVIDAFTHAITAKYPRYRYLVGNDANYMFRILWNLPEWMTDKVLAANILKPTGEH